MAQSDIYSRTSPVSLRKWSDQGGIQRSEPTRDLPRVEVVIIADRYPTGPVDLDAVRKEMRGPSKQLNLSPRRNRGIRGLFARLRGR
jgi:hypothetical protein